MRASKANDIAQQIREARAAKKREAYRQAALDDPRLRYAVRHNGIGKRNARLSDGGPRQAPTLPDKPWQDDGKP
jgi:hypothetical protein